MLEKGVVRSRVTTCDPRPFSSHCKRYVFNPVPVTIGTPAVATVTDLRLVMALVLYQPLALFATFANMLVELEQRNATTLVYEVGIGSRSRDDC
jgi:hypothetical protein